MKVRVIYTKFWTDNYILKLSAKERLLFIFLVTNDKIGISGVYEMPIPLIQLSTGLSLVEIKNFKKRFMLDGKILFCKEWIYLIMANRYQTYTGEKNEIACQRELSLIPKEIINYFLKHSKGYPPYGVLSVGDTLRNQKPIIRNQSREHLDKKELDKIASAIEKKYD